MKAYQPKNIKAHNQALLLSILKEEHRGMTKRQLAEAADLSVVTVNKLLPEMVDNQWIIPLDIPQKTGGRRALAYQFNAMRALVLVIQFVEAHQKIRVSFFITDLNGAVMSTIKEAVTDSKAFQQSLKNIKQTYPSIYKTVVGIPGVEVNGKLELMDAAAFKGVALRSIIAAEISDEIIIENDVNAAVMTYRQDAAIVAAIYFPELFPPGAALVIGDHLFTGANQMSGEIKYLPHFDTVSFPLTLSDVSKHVAASVQAMIAMYDPHKIVVFIPRTWSELISPRTITSYLAAASGAFIVPEITVETDFSQACLTGLIQIGRDAPQMVM